MRDWFVESLSRIQDVSGAAKPPADDDDDDGTADPDDSVTTAPIPKIDPPPGTAVGQSDAVAQAYEDFCAKMSGQGSK